MLETLFILATIIGPAPDAGNCWLAWQWRIELYEVWSGTEKCAELRGFRKQNERWVNPLPVYWPRPGDGPWNTPGSHCWKPGLASFYRIRACTDGICGEFSEFVEFGPQDFMCFDSRGQIPCL